MIPGGQDAKEAAGCRDRECRKRNKYTVLGHRPPHTKRSFFCLKKLFFCEINKKIHAVFHFMNGERFNNRHAQPFV